MPRVYKADDFATIPHLLKSKSPSQMQKSIGNASNLPGEIQC